MKKAIVILSVLLVAFLIFGALSKSKPKLSRKTASSYHDQQLAEGFTHVKLIVPPNKKFCGLIVAEQNHSGKFTNWIASYLPAKPGFKVEFQKYEKNKKKDSIPSVADLKKSYPPQAREFPGNIDLYIKTVPGGYDFRSEIFGTSGHSLADRTYSLISSTVKPGEFVLKSAPKNAAISANNKDLAPNESGVIFLLLREAEAPEKVLDTINRAFEAKEK